MGFIIQLGIFVFLLGVCGYWIGGTVERKHFADLQRREEENQGRFLVTQLNSFPALALNSQTPQIVMTEVVIGSDYLKTWLSQWRNLFGGEMKSFRRLQERAKREAVLRLTERAQELGYNALCNVRINGADIGGNTSGQKKQKLHFAAIIATATAYQAHLAS